MPNGHYHAQCQNCASYAYRKRGRRCRKHDFVLPRLSEVICRDWQVREREARTKPWAYNYAPALIESDEFRALIPGALYYYHYSSSQPPRPLGSFAELQSLVWSVHIRQDEELGWTLYLHSGDYDLLPQPGTPIAIELDGSAYPYLVADLPRRRATGGHRTPSGTWETRYETTTQRTIYSLVAPDALHTWLTVRLDLSAYHTATEANEFKESVRDAGFSAFMMATGEQRTYLLRALDDLLYHPYQRAMPPKDTAGPADWSAHVHD